MFGFHERSAPPTFPYTCTREAKTRKPNNHQNTPFAAYRSHVMIRVHAEVPWYPGRKGGIPTSVSSSSVEPLHCVPKGTKNGQ
eukprot:3629794-Rhodomonas_salina.2